MSQFRTNNPASALPLFRPQVLGPDGDLVAVFSLSFDPPPLLVSDLSSPNEDIIQEYVYHDVVADTNF